ncbi:hypothetical protein [Vibrio mexicanus]|uniref:hypothetical protein n=1 Tax=Vibrio mexicanus TaxID=1004326 RepID=UPI00063CD526|nr:hypothetical protein [Vibrio mexicanus]
MGNDSTNIEPEKASRTSLKVLIKEGYEMLEYVARHGEMSIDPRVAAGIHQARQRVDSKQWNVDDETLLLQCYDQLAKQIYPVTLESLKAVKPQLKESKWTEPNAAKVITWYRRYTVFTLIVVLTIQMYYLFGHTLTQALTVDIQSLNDDPTQWDPALQANYQLLSYWNQIWLMGQKLALEPDPSGKSVDPSVLFSAQLTAAASVLQMLQNYVLPLMYGLLGAFIFVLRSLLYQVRTLTYTASREVGYRLRLTLGCLAGMITGWLMKPDFGEMALSPMAIAFLSGYSIEVLFTLLDRMIDQVRQTQTTSSASSRSPD